MKNISAITYKELLIYFSSPMAYIIAGVFFTLTGVFFVTSIEGAFAEASARALFSNATYFLMPLIPPLLTMRLLAEEQKLGTLELLLTSPVREWEVVIGKYIASLIMLLAILAVTSYYVILMYIFGTPDSGPVLSAYMGLILYGAAALSIGLLGSSLSSNQIVAAVVGTAVLLFFSFINRVSTVIEGAPASFLDALSMESRLADFTRGIIDTSHVIYFLSLIAIFVFITIRALETRRWR